MEGQVTMKDFWLFRDDLRSDDPLLLSDLSQVRPQCFSGKIERIYSRRFERDIPYDSTMHIEFINAGRGWGNRSVIEREAVLIFLSRDSNALIYEKDWHGHFILREINSVLHAIAPWDLLGTEEKPYRFKPDYLCDAAFRLGKMEVAMKFSLFEQHLLSEIARMEELDL